MTGEPGPRQGRTARTAVDCGGPEAGVGPQLVTKPHTRAPGPPPREPKSQGRPGPPSSCASAGLGLQGNATEAVSRVRSPREESSPEPRTRVGFRDGGRGRAREGDGKAGEPPGCGATSGGVGCTLHPGGPAREGSAGRACHLRSGPRHRHTCGRRRAWSPHEGTFSTRKHCLATSAACGSAPGPAWAEVRRQARIPPRRPQTLEGGTRDGLSRMNTSWPRGH